MKRPRFLIPAIDDTQVKTPPGTILFGRIALKERDQNSVATDDPDPPTNPESLGYGERKMQSLLSGPLCYSKLEIRVRNKPLARLRNLFSVITVILLINMPITFKLYIAL